MLMANGTAGMIAIEHQIKGPWLFRRFGLCVRCGWIGTALLMLKAGMIDAALAGATEMTVCSTGVAAFDRVGAMSRRNR